MSNSAKTLLVINPAARFGRVTERWAQQQEKVLGILRKENTEVFFTSAEDHGRKRVRSALKSGFKKIVVIGGDGTISEAIQGFFEDRKPFCTDAVLGVLPSGRGDDFLKTILGHRYLSATKAWTEALEILERGHPRSIDVGQIDWITEGADGSAITADALEDTKGRDPKDFFINITSFAFPGLVVQRVQSKSGFLSNSLIGKSAWTYAVQAFLANGSYRALPLQVKVDGEVLFEGPVHSGYVLNGRYNAGGICWDRTAQLDDGLFNIMVIDGKSTWSSFKNSSRLALSSGEIPEREESGKFGVYFKKGKEVEIRLLDGTPKTHPLFEVDGDLPEPSNARGAVFRAIPKTFQILTLGG